VPKDIQHRHVKYLNNIVEADHGKLKQLIRSVRGFKSMKTACARIKGFEVMRALRKGQAAIFNLTRDIVGEARLRSRPPCALTEAVHLDFEVFRADLDAALPRANRSKGGRPLYDAVLMFKVLVLQTSTPCRTTRPNISSKTAVS
jgi:DDE domain